VHSSSIRYTYACEPAGGPADQPCLQVAALGNNGRRFTRSTSVLARHGPPRTRVFPGCRGGDGRSCPDVGFLLAARGSARRGLLARPQRLRSREVYQPISSHLCDHPPVQRPRSLRGGSGSDRRGQSGVAQGKRRGSIAEDATPASSRRPGQTLPDFIFRPVAP